MTIEARSSVLRRFAAEVVSDPRGARERLSRSLRTCAGPLLEPVPGQPSVMLVTFVLMDRLEQPFVSCQLLPGFPAETPLRPVPSAPGVWWAEIIAPSDVATVYQFQDRPVPEPEGSDRFDPDAIARYVRALHRASHADPFNPHRCYPITAVTVDPGHRQPVPADKWQSIIRLPDAADRDLVTAPSERGRLTQHVVASAALGNSRTVTVWSPPGSTGSAQPILLLLDGEAFLHCMDAPSIFDRLVADGLVRPFTAVLVHNASPHSRSTEYLCDPSFESFLVKELLTRVGCYDNGEMVVGGFSLGGLAACSVALNHTDVVGGVLALSPSLWWTPDARPEWIIRQYDHRRHGGTRFWLEVGSLETEPVPVGPAGTTATTSTTMLDTVRRMRDVLDAAGGELVGYRERPGGHDAVNWRQGLAAGLHGLLGPQVERPSAPGRARPPLSRDEMPRATSPSGQRGGPQQL
jgi:enterochelin esterase family protein